jgi:hypothetical protein
MFKAAVSFCFSSVLIYENPTFFIARFKAKNQENLIFLYNYLAMWYKSL